MRGVQNQDARDTYGRNIFNPENAHVDQVFFDQLIAVDGYVWTRDLIAIGESGQGPFLISKSNSENILLSSKGPYPAAIFHTLASTEATEQGILSFASRFGQLFNSTKNGAIALAPKGGGSVQIGTSLNQWREEIKKIREVVDVWNALQQWHHPLCKSKPLNEILEWCNGGVLFKIPSGTGWLTNCRIKPHRLHELGELSEQNIRKYAEILLLDIIYDHEGRLDNCCLAPNLKRTDTGLKIFYEPKTLLSAAWLGLMDCVAGNTKIRPCQKCGELMDVTKNHARKIYHDKCKEAAKKQRQRTRAKTE